MVNGRRSRAAIACCDTSNAQWMLATRIVLTTKNRIVANDTNRRNALNRERYWRATNSLRLVAQARAGSDKYTIGSRKTAVDLNNMRATKATSTRQQRK